MYTKDINENHFYIVADNNVGVYKFKGYESGEFDVECVYTTCKDIDEEEYMANEAFAYAFKKACP